MQMRTSKPTNGNPYYVTKSRGGYSQCIQGYPTDPSCNVLANCVGYACGRFNEIIGKMLYPALNCNAENFIERAKQLGLSISQKPSLGAIMVWQKGSLSGSDGAGHVEVVERVDSDIQVYTSASNYAGTPFYNATRNNKDGKWGIWSGYSFRGFIVNPAVTDEGDDMKKFKIFSPMTTVVSSAMVNEGVPAVKFPDGSFLGYNFEGDARMAREYTTEPNGGSMSKTFEDMVKEMLPYEAIKSVEE